jgi:hypothetical protein
VGGVLSRFDGKTWQTYTASNSGYSGAEATTTHGTVAVACGLARRPPVWMCFG